MGNILILQMAMLNHTMLDKASQHKYLNISSKEGDWVSLSWLLFFSIK